MNEETESFEQRLRRQPLRPLPTEWRREILEAASEACPVQPGEIVSRYSFLSELRRRFASVLWPHPVAWGGLAVVWALIFAVNISTQDKPANMAVKALPSPEVIGQSPEQQRLYAQLMGFQLTGSDDPSNPDRQKAIPPKPRSERIEFETKAAL
ncbi:MAG TPA: hypothetical protein VMF08_23305 [Candidatus Sulfotelmatobacter sp.]|nr:hypothetical protein [Candidatus Sulfotelmatobacter sp.]